MPPFVVAEEEAAIKGEGIRGTTTTATTTNMMTKKTKRTKKKENKDPCDNLYLNSR